MRNVQQAWQTPDAKIHEGEPGAFDQFRPRGQNDQQDGHPANVDELGSGIVAWDSH